MTGVGYFYYLLYNDISVFFIYCLVFWITYFLIFRRYVYSLFDPLLLIVIFSSFQTIDIFFMYHMGSISEYLFRHYILTQFLFILGFLLIRPMSLSRFRKQASWQSIHTSTRATSILYYTSSVVFMVTQSASYIALGIPMFMEARLLTYKGGGGVGLLGRVISVASTITIFLLVDRMFGLQKRKLLSKSYDSCVFVISMASLLSTGAKGSVLFLLYIVFLYGLFYCRFKGYAGIQQRLKRFQIGLLTLAFIGATVVVLVEGSRTTYSLQTNPVIVLLQRFVQSGDIFMYAYQDNVIEQMERSNPIVVMFADFLGMSRLMSWDAIPIELGNQLHRFHTGNDLPMGPNPVHNVFGLFYFGFGISLMYSFCMGWLLGFFRNKLLFLLPKSTIGGVLFVLLTNASMGLSVDFTYAISQFDNIAIVGLPLIAFALMAAHVTRIIDGRMDRVQRPNPCPESA